jgi:hypothetical protein
MIVSVSRRTDVPAWHADWFARRIREGFATVRNPFGGASVDVSVRPADVDGFVFWTRNGAPFFDVAADLAAVGYRFYFHYTILGYPRPLDPATPSVKRAVADARRLAEAFGPAAVVWRYDPVILTDVMTAAWHEDNFARIAADMTGVTDEAVVSFVDFYRKVGRNLPPALREAGMAATDPAPDELGRLTGRLAVVAADCGMRLSLCCEPDIVAPGAGRAACVDPERLVRNGATVGGVKRAPTRTGCGCYRSRDIGAYDTCPAGCAYCYAVRNRATARDRYRRRDPFAPRLGE